MSETVRKLRPMRTFSRKQGALDEVLTREDELRALRAMSGTLLALPRGAQERCLQFIADAFGYALTPMPVDVRPPVVVTPPEPPKPQPPPLRDIRDGETSQQTARRAARKTRDDLGFVGRLRRLLHA